MKINFSTQFSSLISALMITLVSVALLTSCGKDDVQKGKMSSDILNASQDFNLMTFSTLQPNVGYKLFINGEPVQCGTSPGFYTTQSFPFKKGSNHIKVTLSFLAKDEIPKQTKVYAYDWSLSSQIKSQTPQVLADEFGAAPYDSDKEWEFDIEGTNAIKPSIDFDRLGTNRDELMNECCVMSKELAGLIQNQDTKKLAEVFSISEIEVEKQFMQIKTPSEFTTTGIESNAKVTALCGDHFIVVFCGDNQEINIGKSFVTSTHKEGNKTTSVKIDNMVFARLNGKWLVRRIGDNWISINRDRLREQNTTGSKQ